MKNMEGDKYIQLLNLVALENQRWPEDFLFRSAMALVLLGILRRELDFRNWQPIPGPPKSIAPKSEPPIFFKIPILSERSEF